jgi:hypothetical protein
MDKDISFTLLSPNLADGMWVKDQLHVATLPHLRVTTPFFTGAGVCLCSRILTEWTKCSNSLHRVLGLLS